MNNSIEDTAIKPQFSSTIIELSNNNYTHHGKYDQYEVSQKSESYINTNQSHNNGQGTQPQLKRGLKDRHISLIALAGIIGPGILVGAGLALNHGGPAALIIGFGIIGIIAFSIMQSLGELATLYPTGGAFSTYCNRFIDPAFGAAIGWNYVIIWVAVLANEYNTLSAIMRFWGPQVPLYGYILMFWFFFLGFQLLGVEVFGEVEYWLALFKLIGLVVFYVFSIVYVSGGVKNHHAFGFQYWNNPGALSHGFRGIATVFVFCSTFYSGTESVALTAAEARNPSRAIPKAIRQTFLRIVIVYMGVAISYGMTVPYNDPNLLDGGSKTLKSPITIALVRAGWGHAGHLVNAFILITCVSAINSSIYIGSRTMVNLAHEGSAPAFLGKVLKNGVPIYTIILMNLFGLISLMNVSTGAANAYDYIVNLSGVSVFIVWGAVSFVHIRFRKSWKLQGRSVEELPYKALWFPYLSWFGLAANVFLGLVQGWSYFKPFDAGNFVDAYILFPVSAIIFLIVKFWNKTKWVDLSSVDLDAGKRVDDDAALYEEKDEQQADIKWYERLYIWKYI